MRATRSDSGVVKLPVIIIAGVAAVFFVSMLMIPVFFGANSLFQGVGGGGGDCTDTAGAGNQPGQSADANGIPANYLTLYKAAGAKFGIPWNVLAGIGAVETNHGRSNLPGVHSGTNFAGAAGPMQFEAATFAVYGVDGDNDGKKDIYDPADAIFSAANYLKHSGAPTQTSSAIFTYNHSQDYVNLVLSFAQRYASGTFQVMQANLVSCSQMNGGALPPNAVAAQVIAYAKAQIGKPYIWGGTGPTGYDCSGLTSMAYKSAGITIPRLANYQWFDEPHVAANQVEPGDLVFFAGSDGTQSDPGHVGMVYNPQQMTMIVARHTGTNITIQSYRNYPGGVVGYSRPTAKPGAAAQ
jgi:cell wall-associated NlpC family hydrolase